MTSYYRDSWSWRRCLKIRKKCEEKAKQGSGLRSIARLGLFLFLFSAVPSYIILLKSSVFEIRAKLEKD